MTGRPVLQLVIGLVLLGGGAVALLYPHSIWTLFARIADVRRDSAFLGYSQRIWSIRASGIVIMLMGVFLVWMYWRHR